jgi:hypothetical protein
LGKAIAGDRGIDAIVDTIGPNNRVDNLDLLGPEGGLACIAGIPDLTVVPDLPYSISIHDIGLGGVLASPAFRRRQEGLGRMATELMALVQDGKITPTVAEQITLEAIPKALERLAEGACPRQNSCQSAKLIRVSRANSDIPIPPSKNNIYRRKISSEELGSRPLTSGGDGNHAKIEITRNGCGPGQSG